MRRILLLGLVLFVLNMEAKAQLFGRDWNDGCYYTIKNHKVTGLISWTPPTGSIFSSNGDHIFFKADSNSKKIKISSDTLTAFVMGKDSFAVSHFADLANKPFLRVMIDRPIKLYFSGTTRQSSMGGVSGVPIGIGFGGGVKTTYYYGPNPNNITELDRKSFIDIMTKIMADKADVVEAIKNKTFKFGAIDELITYYKTGKKTQEEN
jgi:hypothetical protein